MRCARKLQWIGVTVALLLAFSSDAFAQASGTINGRVVDQADAVMPGVTLTATSAATGITHVAVTNGEGLYSIPGLEPGVYSIRAELPGFSTITREGIALPVTATITINLALSVAGLSENVTVGGAAPIIETTQSKVSST